MRRAGRLAQPHCRSNGDPDRILHTMHEMARASAIACGYEDANDLDRLRHDPLMKLAPISYAVALRLPRTVVHDTIEVAPRLPPRFKPAAWSFDRGRLKQFL